MPTPRTSLLARLVVSVTLAASLTTVASAEAVRVPVAPPPHAVFAQPPQPQRRIAPPDGDLAPSLDRVAVRASVRAALARARQRNLAAFRAYQKKGVFPNNTFADRTLNVWRDADGHFCAAATIIRTAGLTELADRVAEQTNFIRLADVTQGPLMDWILTSGFTQEEIAAIQAPFAPVAKPAVQPEQPLVVDARRRAAEDARLRAIYRRVDRMLVANEKKSLELAVDRLMAHPQLAWHIASAE